MAMAAANDAAGNGGRSLDVTGAIAMTTAVLIWAGFALSVRSMGASPLATADIALIRFGVPSLLLLPFLPSRLAIFRRLRMTDALMVLVGAGLPFFWIAAAGGRETSTAHVSALVAGTVPLSVAILYFLMGKGLPARRQMAGLAAIILGVAVLSVAQPAVASGHVWRGCGLLLLASLLWGAYTIALRRSALDPVSSALLLAVPCFLMLVVLMATGAVETHLGAFTFHDALPFILLQGIGVGIVSSMAYAVAVSRLGPTRSTVFGAMAPALATVEAVPLLGESLTLPIALGVAAITLGVIHANRR
ncbi:EamA-like transporter family protein [Rhizobium sp. RU20A]|nr:EamA-like transporter family protein [Rhizobium sp. RU20A]